MSSLDILHHDSSQRRGYSEHDRTRLATELGTDQMRLSGRNADRTQRMSCARESIFDPKIACQARELSEPSKISYTRLIDVEGQFPVSRLLRINRKPSYPSVQKLLQEMSRLKATRIQASSISRSSHTIIHQTTRNSTYQVSDLGCSTCNLMGSVW